MSSLRVHKKLGVDTDERAEPNQQKEEARGKEGENTLGYGVHLLNC